MKIRNVLLSLAAVLAAWAMAPTGARADEVLYDGIGFLQGTQSFVDSFDLPSAGTLTVTLSDIAWPQPLADLDLLVTSTKGALGPETGAGTYTFNVNGGDVFAEWFGTAQGPLNAGVYSLKIDFQPNALPVPLPTSALLLLSGLALLAWQRRIQSADASASARPV